MAMKILVIDVGGTRVKFLATGHKTHREVASGSAMTARKMVTTVKRLAKDWKYDAVSIGYPGPVLRGRPALEPHNVGGGWVRFDYAKAFGCPVRIVNDAAMQALGAYRQGSMLFLGLGTGLGTALVVDGVLAPMELGQLPYKKSRTYENYLGAAGLKRLGKRKWRKHVKNVATRLKAAGEAEDLVVGGGNARKLKALPAGARRVNNMNAFAGGFRLWDDKSTGKTKPKPAGEKAPARKRA
jgi:predicted NBD/HSP70 family sugar kinase